MTEHPLDDLAAYSLGILDPEEQRAVGRHLAGCATCGADVASLGETAWTIAETAGRAAPARLRGAIVEQARRTGASPAGPRASLWSLFLRPVPMVVPLALAVVLVIGLAGYAGARRDAERYSSAVAAAVGARVVPLAATVAGMRGSVVVPANGGRPYLILDLPAAPAGKIWEAWVIRGEVATRAGITADRGLTTRELTAVLAPGDTVAITAEPPGGVDRPTGAPVMAGKT